MTHRQLIKEHLKTKGFSQLDVAKMRGVHPCTVTRWLSDDLNQQLRINSDTLLWFGHLLGSEFQEELWNCI